MRNKTESTKDTNTINKDVLRYIELSQKFEKSESELFGNEYSSYSIGYNTIVYNHNTPEPCGRTERIEKLAKDSVQRSKDYDEYLSLRIKIKEYFTAISLYA